MIGRMLALLAAAVVTMGAVAVPAPLEVTETSAERAQAAISLARLADAAERSASAVRAVLPGLGLDSVAPAPATAAAWWSALSGTERLRLERSAPDVVGNLDGLPYPIRDRVNRAALATAIAAAEAAGPDGVRSEAMQTASRLRTLQRIRSAITPAVGGAARSLIAFDSSTAARAAIAVGDVQTASAVDFLVPGMYFTVRDQIVDWTNTASVIQAEQTAWLTRLHTAGGSAVISWIGYQTPDILNVLGLGLAEQGASRLADAVNGIKAARGGHEPFVGVLAHSYGATAAMLALHAHTMSVGALAMVGAPGSPATAASTLAVPAGQVFVGVDAWDGVAVSGFFGPSTAESSWGATRLGTNGGVDPLTGARLAGTAGHNGYFDPGSESMRNLALIGIGRGDLVTSGMTTAAGRLMTAGSLAGRAP